MTTSIDRLATLNRIRRLSRLMDTAIRIPGTSFRFGLDPIIGLVPGAGDLVSTAFSAYIIFLAARFGLPREVLTKMIFNVALEAFVGSVPLVGDLFDAVYKSNIRNLDLLEKQLQVVEPALSNIKPLVN
ncbi:Mn-dependent transcriptional regulator [uncultured Synechococcales cyanobacterium]|uniref:Mn-dependent transcriptional regulator n=1 Tax=uncultured Synechococcales cyanobacterium TaxID=1936017 RepID=A0A6J4VS83_9CYAN|nr:Mn-dependent transcriptional regulator [uncultured Synechococcales cyanobacterium]